MIRRFQFEAEIYESLSCVPMQARRKLDALGLKIGLAQWQRLGRGERLMICHAPAETQEERNALRVFVEEATMAKAGSPPKELSEQARGEASPPPSPPSILVANARQFGVELDQEKWNRLDEDQRYALVKLGAKERPSHNLPSALREFFPAQG
jgi:hypothetical protein